MVSKPNKLHKKTIPPSRSRRDLPSGIISASGHRNRVDYCPASTTVFYRHLAAVRRVWYPNLRNLNKKHVGCLDPDETCPAESFPHRLIYFTINYCYTKHCLLPAFCFEHTLVTTVTSGVESVGSVRIHPGVGR